MLGSTTKPALLTALKTGGSRALTINASATSLATTEGMLVLWDDGSTAHLSVLSTGTAVTDGNTTTAFTLTTLADFVGISSSTSFAAFDFTIVT